MHPVPCRPKSATRLIATGLVLAYVTGLSDLLGIGTHVDPSLAAPSSAPCSLAAY